VLMLRRWIVQRSCAEIEATHEYRITSYSSSSGSATATDEPGSGGLRRTGTGMPASRSSQSSGGSTSLSSASREKSFLILSNITPHEGFERFIRASAAS